MSTPQAYFADLYRDSDPYGYRTRWYERRKRSLLMAALTEPRYASAWELGCSIGVTTAELAPRCDRLLATDFSPRAVEIARASVGDAHVTFRSADHPRQWPDGRFDLIVFSEVGYFMDRAALSRTVHALGASLARGGSLVACHWRRPFDEAPLDGDGVHEALQQALPLTRAFSYVDADFRLEGWSDRADSIAQREFLR